MEDRIITYGGQAVIEGVLMRGRKALAIGMRAPDGKIVVHTEKLAKVYQSSLAKIPFLRGVILLWDALGLGMRALTISANTQTGEDEKLEGAPLYLTLALSLASSSCFPPLSVAGWRDSSFPRAEAAFCPRPRTMWPPPLPACGSVTWWRE
jgi:uncharacterized protein YqhQ